MAVEQEMAEVYPPDAEDLAEYLPGTDCGQCSSGTCIEFSEALLSKKQTPADCPDLEPELADLIVSILKLDMSPIPYDVMMAQVPCKVIEINQPKKNSALLITCNFCETVTILQHILESTGTRAFLLPTATHGYSVDNAVYERMFKAIEVWKAIKENSMEEKIDKPIIVIPGLAESVRMAVRQLTKWDVQVGPVSGFLVPLFCYANFDLFSN